VHPVLFTLGALLIPSYGALAAAGVLVALVLAQRTARTAGVSPAHVWNVCVIALFTALLGSRLLLLTVNWRELLAHPLWMLGLATIHNPWVAGAGILMGGVAALAYMRWQHMPMMATLDGLAAPLTLGLALEQFGALLAGAGYGTETSVPWAVVYTHPLAQRWSGTPLGVPLHPVQAYAALAYATLAVLLLIWMPLRRQPGDVAGVAIMGIGVTLYITEFWRDPEGRGQVLHGALDGPQVAAMILVLIGALVLMERSRLAANGRVLMEHGTLQNPEAKHEKAHD
jgi:phosphatidylglycerol:prolipoprotein diacylglycerol transferase